MKNEINKKGNVLRGLFGSIKFSKPTGEILKEVREDFMGFRRYFKKK